MGHYDPLVRSGDLITADSRALISPSGSVLMTEFSSAGE
jgi:hypothetical protein